MHISDGVLPPETWIGGYAVTAGLTALGLRKVKEGDVPKVSVLTAAFFVASLIHVPVGPTSVHLVLNSLAGIVLGWAAYPAILVGLVLQALLFQFGGVTTVGINTLNMGLPAVVAGYIFKLRKKFPGDAVLWGALAGFEGILGGALLLSLSLWTTGEGFLRVAQLAFVAHIPVAVVEAAITAAAAGFLQRTRPEVLEG
ncbi:MAG TPA: cobalt transporter CbiM [Candidatus Latescibacteria bacterium]|nr:cobalt transporter CbiM [Candidatus Latescibacterota bacterium]